MMFLVRLVCLFTLVSSIKVKKHPARGKHPSSQMLDSRLGQLNSNNKILSRIGAARQSPHTADIPHKIHSLEDRMLFQMAASESNVGIVSEDHLNTAAKQMALVGTSLLLIFATCLCAQCSSGNAKKSRLELNQWANDRLKERNRMIQHVGKIHKLLNMNPQRESVFEVLGDSEAAESRFLPMASDNVVDANRRSDLYGSSRFDQLDSPEIPRPSEEANTGRIMSRTERQRHSSRTPPPEEIKDDKSAIKRSAFQARRNNQMLVRSEQILSTQEPGHRRSQTPIQGESVYDRFNLANMNSNAEEDLINTGDLGGSAGEQRDTVSESEQKQMDKN